jgi:hypothetical protein
VNPVPILIAVQVVELGVILFLARTRFQKTKLPPSAKRCSHCGRLSFRTTMAMDGTLQCEDAATCAKAKQ